MTIQKTYRNGNSVAVTIPKDYLEELNLRSGAEVLVEKKGRRLVITPRESSIDAKFMQMVTEFTDEHEDVLAELANRA